MNRRWSLLVAWVLFAGILGGAQIGRADPSPSEVGQWLAPFSEGGLFDGAPPATKDESKAIPTAGASVVLRDGRILYWNNLEGSEAPENSIGLELPEPNTSRSRVLTLAGPSWITPTPEDGGGGDLFCSDQRHLADGRVIVVGGTEWTNENAGSGLPVGRTELNGTKSVRIFDPDANTWSPGPSMNYRRWYPTLITLPNGRLLAAGGVSRLVYNSKMVPGAHAGEASDVVPINVSATEIFDPKHPKLGWQLTGPSGETSLPLFARLHLLPNGRVLYDATGQMWGPAGEAVDEFRWNIQKWYDPSTNSWQELGPAPLGARSGAFSVMLPLQPPYETARILIAGGTLGTSPGSYVSNSLSEILTWQDGLSGGSISRAPAAPMNNIRWYSSGVVLPSGEVLAFSGADRDEVIDPGSEMAVHTPEMYDPVANTWSELRDTHDDGTPVRDRTYHNTAVLLRDGSVLVGGHAPIPAHYGSQGNSFPGGPFANNFRDPSFEIFKPPYLFRGDRPVIQAVPQALNPGVPFTVKTQSWEMTSLHVVLSRLPATTHITDADQRTVELGIEARGTPAGTVTVTVPDDLSIVPAGYYYLFLLQDNGDGPTPSVAEIVKVV